LQKNLPEKSGQNVYNSAMIMNLSCDAPRTPNRSNG